MRSLLRILFGRFGRALGVVIIVAAAWFYWWAWPERPMQQMRFEQIASEGLELADGGRKLVVFGQTQEQPAQKDKRLSADQVRIMDLTTHRDVLATTSIVASKSSDDGKLIAIVSPDFTIQVVSISEGKQLLTIAGDGIGTIPKLRILSGDRLLMVTRQQQGHVVNEFWSIDKASKIWEVPRDDLVFSPNGRYCSWRANGSLVVVESASGREIARSSAVAMITAAGWDVHPDGNEVVITASIKGSKFYRAATLALPDFTEKKSFEFKVMTHTCPVPKYSSTGRLLTVETGEGSLWDWSDEKPRILDPCTWNNGYFVLVASDDRHYILSPINRPVFQFCRTGEASPKLTGSGIISFSPVFSHSGRLLLVPSNVSEREYVIWIRQKLRSLFGINLSIDGFYLVIDVDQARITKTFPLHYGALGFGPGETTFWTQQGAIDQATGKKDVTIRQYSTLPATPPWWLYLLTAAGIAFIGYDFHRGRAANASAKRR